MPTLNIHSKSSDWRSRRLSNFSVDFFELDGATMMSVEGFIQGIKFPEGDRRRNMAFNSAGSAVKRLGSEAAGEFVYWQGREIPYGSIEHMSLIERAIRAKFEQNDGARQALMATVGLVLTHEVPGPENPKTSLPAERFCVILAGIRAEFGG